MSVGAQVKALLDEGGIKYAQNRKSYILDCPRCRKAKKLFFRKSDGNFVCWKCQTDGFRGAPEWGLQEILGLGIKVLQKRLYGESAPRGSVFLDLHLVDWFDEQDEVPVYVKTDLPAMEYPPDFLPIVDPRSARGAEYLAGRGLVLDVCQQYDVRYHPSSGSVVFPVINGGKILGWQTRVCGATSWFDPDNDVVVKIIKSLTSEGLKKEQTLMFGDRVTGDHAVLCEGPIDAMKAHLCGGNVASMGKAVSRYQLEMLKNSGIRKLYLGLDPDAFKESSQILSQMIDDIEIYDMRPPAPFEDLGSMSMQEVKVLWDQAPKMAPNHLFLYLKDLYE